MPVAVAAVPVEGGGVRVGGRGMLSLVGTGGTDGDGGNGVTEGGDDVTVLSVSVFATLSFVSVVSPPSGQLEGRPLSVSSQGHIQKPSL